MGFGGMNSGSNSIGRRSIPTSLAEINMTPLVDVMLVLLIVFMISAPLMQQGIQVDLPKASSNTMNEVPDQLVLVVDRSRRISIADHVLKTGTLSTKLQAIAEAKPGVEVLIQADQSLNYGYIAQVMAEVKKAGISRVGLVTEPNNSKVNL